MYIILVCQHGVGFEVFLSFVDLWNSDVDRAYLETKLWMQKQLKLKDELSLNTKYLKIKTEKKHYRHYSNHA